MQHQWLSGSENTKQEVSSGEAVPLKYFIKRAGLYWSTGEAVISIGFFMLYSLPVSVTTLFFKNELQTFIREGYLLLYFLLLLFFTYLFFWLVNLLYWMRRLKKSLLDGSFTC